MEKVTTQKGQMPFEHPESVATPSKRSETKMALMDVIRTMAQRLEATPIPTFVIDQNHIVTHWNPACESLTGIKAESVIGTRDQWRAFYRRKRPVLADLIVNGAPEAELETYYRDKYRRSDVIEGAYEAEAFFEEIGPNGRWLFFTAAPIKGKDGRIHGAVETLQDFTLRRRAEQRLKEQDRRLKDQTRHLAEVNRALKSLLDHREVEKRAVEENMLMNLKKMVYPYLDRMAACRLDDKGRTYLEILRSNLNELIASHAYSLTAVYLDLTPREIEIADLIRRGKSTKEIAEIVTISPGSVGFHRNNIRRKLGLLNRKTNLRTYLNSRVQTPQPDAPHPLASV